MYVPRADVAAGALAPAEKRTVCPYKGEASYWSVAGIEPTPRGATRRRCPTRCEVQGHVAFDAERVDVELGEPRADLPQAA